MHLEDITDSIDMTVPRAMNDTRCGFIAIMGRPNVGKSSLLNAIIGKKISIISFKPQTTRQQILGIKTYENTQIVYVDTPGLHLGAKKALNRQMNKSARSALCDVNAVVFVVDTLHWTDEDEMVCDMLKELSCPIVVALNKVDLLEDKSRLLSFMDELSQKMPQAEIIPISALKRLQVDVIEKLIDSYIPQSPFYFPHEQQVNHTDQFAAAEIVREKLLKLLDKEVPYSICVEIELLEHKENIVNIAALIWVEREGQKAIVVGERGSMLKNIGIHARRDLERYFDKKVCLKTWVKVKNNWSDDARALQSLGLQT